MSPAYFERNLNYIPVSSHEKAKKLEEIQKRRQKLKITIKQKTIQDDKIKKIQKSQKSKL